MSVIYLNFVAILSAMLFVLTLVFSFEALLFIHEIRRREREIEKKFAQGEHKTNKDKDQGLYWYKESREL